MQYSFDDEKPPLPKIKTHFYMLFTTFSLLTGRQKVLRLFQTFVVKTMCHRRKTVVG